MLNPEIILTKDGSHSLLNRELNETYHSVHGALQESQYVFIEQGLKFWCDLNKERAVVFEVGFGTGLNALLALEYSILTGKKIRYVTVEKFPLPAEIWSRLNYADRILSPDKFKHLHLLPWENEHQITNSFTFIKHNAAVADMPLQNLTNDIIFYDAFAPSKQPEMWDVEILSLVTSTLRSGGIFVTYCAKGQLKRDLKSFCLEVETLPGPPGKKEMVRALKTKEEIC